MKKLGSISVFSKISQLLAIFLSIKYFNLEGNLVFLDNWIIFLSIFYLLPLLYLGFNTTYFNNSKKFISESRIDYFFTKAISIMIIIVGPACILGYFLIKFLYPELPDLLLIIALLSTFLQFSNTILYSLSKEKLALLLSSLTWFFLAIVCFIFLFFEIENYILFLFSYITIYFIFSFIGFILCFKYYKFLFRIKLKYVKSILNKSIEFWASSLSANFINSGQILIIEWLDLTNNLAEYFIIQKIFSFISTAHLAYISPYNLKFMEMIRLKKWDNLIRLINDLNFKFSLPIISFISLILILTHTIILNIIAQDQSDGNYILCFIFALNYIIFSLSNIYSIYLNTIGRFKIQITFSICNIILVTLMMILFKNIFDLYSFVLATMFSGIILLLFYIKIVLNSIKIKWLAV